MSCFPFFSFLPLSNFLQFFSPFLDRLSFINFNLILNIKIYGNYEYEIKESDDI